MSKRVWIYAEQCVRAGEVVVSRYQDFDLKPDSDDFRTLDRKTAQQWASLEPTAANAFMRRAGRNVLDYAGVK